MSGSSERQNLNNMLTNTRVLDFVFQLIDQTSSHIEYTIRILFYNYYYYID